MSSSENRTLTAAIHKAFPPELKGDVNFACCVGRKRAGIGDDLDLQFLVEAQIREMLFPDMKV